MIIRIIWILIVLNSLALVAFIVFSLVDASNSRTHDPINSSYIWGMFAVGVIVILLSAVPLLLSQQKASLIMSGFFAGLPWVVGLGLLASNYLPSLGRPKTMAEIYYHDKKQRAIAAAIEGGDTTLLVDLLPGADPAVQGNRVWDWDGLNYLQFAVRLRANGFGAAAGTGGATGTAAGATNAAAADEANVSCIRILVKAGSPLNPALGEAIRYCPVEVKPTDTGDVCGI